MDRSRPTHPAQILRQGTAPVPAILVVAAMLMAAALLAALLGCAGSDRISPESNPFAPTLRVPSLDHEVFSSKPIELPAWLHLPEGAGPFPAIVFLHGCGGMYAKNGGPITRARDWTARLNKQGYAILEIDSFSPRGVREVCTMSPQPVTGERQRWLDARGALRWLQAQPNIRAHRIAVMGWSHGGSTTLFSIDAQRAAQDPPPPGPDFRAAVAFYPGCLEAAKHSWSTHVPLLLLIGDLDNWTPAEPCRALAARAREAGVPFDLRVYPESYHDFDMPNERLRTFAAAKGGTNSLGATVGTNPAARADAIERVPAFLQEHLKP